MRKPIKYTLIGIAALIGLILVALVGLRIYLGTESAQRMIQAKVDDAIPGAITWNSLSFSLSRGRIEMTDALLEGPDGEKIAGFDRIFIDVAWTDLFGGTLTVNRFTLEKPWADIRRDADGTLNIAEAFPEPGPSQPEPEKKKEGGPPVNIVVTSAAIKGGSVRFQAEDPELSASVKGIDLDLNLDLQGRTGRFTFTVAEGHIQSPELTADLDKLRAEASLADGRLDPVVLRMDTLPLSVDVTGAVDDIFQAPALDIVLLAEASLPEIRKLLGIEPSLTGDVTARASVSGPLADPDGEIHLTYGGGRIFDRPVAGIDLDAVVADRVVDLSGLTVRAAGGSLAVKGQVDLQEAFGDGFLAPPTDLSALAYDLKVSGEPLDLAQLAGEEGGLRGTLRPDLSIAGKGIDPQTLTSRISADLAADGLSVGGLGDPVDVRLDAQAKMADGTAVVETLKAAAGKIDLTARGRYDLSSRDLSAEASLDAPDLSSTLASLGVTGIQGEARLDARVSGPMDRPAFDATLTGNGLGFQEIAIGDLRIDAAMDEAGKLTLSTLSVENRGSAITGSGSMDLFTPEGSEQQDLPLDLTLRLREVAPADFLRNEGAPRGTFTGRLALSGTLKAPEATLALTGTGLAVPAARIGDLDLSARFADGVVHIEPLTITNGESALTARGSAKVLDPESLEPLDAPTFDLAVTSDGIRLADFVADGSGTLTLDAALRGSTAKPTAQVSLTGTDLAYPPATIGSAAVEADLAESGLLTLSRLRVENQGSVVAGDGTIRLYEGKPGFDPALPLSIDLNLADVEAGDFVANDIAKGKLDGSVALSGSIAAPQVSVDLTGEGLAVEETRLGNLVLRAGFADGRVAVETATVRNGDSSLTVDGTARVLDPATGEVLADPAFDLAVSADPVHLEDFLPEMEGAVTLKADLSGSVESPKGSVSLTARELDLGPQKIRNITLDARLDGRMIRVDPLVVSIDDDNTIRGTGQYGLDGSYQVDLAAENLALTAIGPVREADVVEGTASLDLSGRGTISDPALSGTIDVRNLNVRGKPLEDLSLQVRLRDRIAEVAADLNFHVEGTYNLDTRNFSASADFNRTPLGPYLRLANQERLGGSLTGRIEASGKADSLSAVEAEADFSGVRIRMDDRDLVTTRDLRASLADGRLTLPGTDLTLLDGGRLRVAGGLGIDGGPLSLDLDGKIPLAVARPFLDAVPDLSGTLTLDATVDGALSQPAIRGDLALENGAMSVPGLAQRLHGINGKVKITPDALKIADLAGRMDDGRFTLSGRADLDPDFSPTAIDLTLAGDRLPVEVPGTLDLSVNADLAMKGDPASAALTGEVVLLEGTYYKDVDLNPIGGLLKGVTQRSRETAPSPVPETFEEKPKPSLLTATELDVEIKPRNPFIVDNNLAYLEVQPDLTLDGTLARIVVNGRADIRSGTVTYQGKNFEVTRGIIDFVNPYEIEPTLDIAAQVAVREWTIRLAVTGTPENLNIKMSSRPPLEDNDILSLLLFGSTSEELIQGEGGTSQAPARMVADIVQRTVGEDIKAATGLDILEVNVNGSGDGDDAEGGVEVTVGKELSRRMAVKYSVESKDGEMVRKTTAEYKLLENLLMSGFQDSKGTFGGELQYRLEFR